MDARRPANQQLRVTGRDYNGIPMGRPTTFVIGARINPAATDFVHELSVARRKLGLGASASSLADGMLEPQVDHPTRPLKRRLLCSSTEAARSSDT